MNRLHPSMLVVILMALFLSACDIYRKDKCEWYLVAEPEDAMKVEPGWVALCARNYVINKQRCNLRAKLDYARQVSGKPFRYSSLKVKPGRYPKEVAEITLCQADR